MTIIWTLLLPFIKFPKCYSPGSLVQVLELICTTTVQYLKVLSSEMDPVEIRFIQ